MATTRFPKSIVFMHISSWQACRAISVRAYYHVPCACVHLIPHRNYQSLSIEYNFNWCWHDTLHLKKTIPIFKNLLKIPGTTTKVLSYLKIPLITIRIDRFASCENVILRLQTSSILPLPLLHPWSLTSLEETFLQPVLKSFIKVFIQCNEGLENKLTRAPLLGLVFLFQL